MVSLIVFLGMIRTYCIPIMFFSFAIAWHNGAMPVDAAWSAAQLGMWCLGLGVIPEALHARALIKRGMESTQDIHKSLDKLEEALKDIENNPKSRTTVIDMRDKKDR